MAKARSPAAKAKSGSQPGAKVASKAKATRRRASAGRGDPLCTFCGRSHRKVEKLIAGPGVYICDACVTLCNDILADLSYQDTNEGWQGWESMPDDELLLTLSGALKSAENVREGLQARVDELRRRAVSWAKIGEALGMSRQAAWERFA